MSNHGRVTNDLPNRLRAIRAAIQEMLDLVQKRHHALAAETDEVHPLTRPQADSAFVGTQLLKELRHERPRCFLNVVGVRHRLIEG